jgi:hypothetical protein
MFRCLVMGVLALCTISAVAQPVEVAPGVLLLGQIQNPEISESSGIAMGKRAKGAFWTHNDSGADMVYAISETGESIAQWKIKDTEIQNAEDIAVSGGKIYIADIGNNDTSRKEVVVYAIFEPPARVSGGEISPLGVWVLDYPGDEFDSESFFISRGSGYIISKELQKGDVRLYRFPLSRVGARIKMDKMGKLNVNDEARGASISPDGKRLAVITGKGAYLFMFKRIPGKGDEADPTLFVPFEDDTMEGCAITPEGLLVTSEGRNIYLFTDPLFRTKYRAPKGKAK